MNTRSTWRLFLAAVAVFLFIFFFESRQLDSEDRQKVRPKIFPNLDVAAVSSIEVRYTNAVIRAEKTNGVWRLLTPPYPAQATPIETFLANLATLERKEIIPPSEINAREGGLKQFGLETPNATVVINQSTNRFQLYLGARTPLIEGLYAQIPGSTEVIVTDPSVARLLPQSATEWRSPMLISLAGREFDHIQIRAGARLLEFGRDPAQPLWRISKPTAARANAERINSLLQTLATARVTEFVSDSPNVDLERFGLQTPELEVAFLQGTNRVIGLDFGASPTNDPGQVYARRLTTTNIVLTSRAVTEPLLQGFKAFHDQRLLSTPADEISQIATKHPAGGFTLEKQTNGLWQITQPAPMATDQDLAKLFVTNLLRMEIVDFPKDVPDEADLKQFGLDAPRYSVSLFTARTNGLGGLTNALATQLNFGTNLFNGGVYARRSDEIPVYLALDGEMLMLPRHAWQLRYRRVFDFSPTNVTALVLSYQGQTNRIARDTSQAWNADPIVHAAVEEAVFRLGLLFANAWVDKGAQSMANRGFTPGSLTIAAEVTRDGVAAPVALMFGRRTARGNYFAATVLPGETEPTIFEFSKTLYDDLAQALGLPKGE